MQGLHSRACCRLESEKLSLEWNNARPRSVCCCSDDSDAVSFFRCALNIRLLSRMTRRRRGVVLTRTFWVPMKILESEVLSLDQVEKGHTSLLPAFKFNFHSWLQIKIEFTTDWVAASASSFLWAVVRIETSSAKRAITASSLSGEAKLFM